MTSRNVTEHRDRYSIFRLCDCPTCEGSGKGPGRVWSKVSHERVAERCLDCRGEGKIRDEIATADSAEAVGVALVTLAQEGEFEECPLGLLDRRPDCPECEGEGCDKCNGTGIKPTGTWLVLPWNASPRNVSDAGRVLARSKKK